MQNGLDLVPVHGGLAAPVDRVVPLSERAKLVAEAAKLPSIALTRADLSTVHRLADGTLSPLEGPMGRDAWHRVLDEGVVLREGKRYAWGIPLSLPVTDAEARTIAASGSAALPATLAAFWRERSGAIPLERYGMTEIGVALSNPLSPERRLVGHVGFPLPEIDVRLVDGALEVRGPTVFAGYHRRPEATAESLAGGWFKTGDVAAIAPSGHYRLLGRTSVDILKSGGEKVSALHIEEVLREHPAVADAAVVGLPDEAWGDRIVAAVIAHAPVAVDELRGFCRERLAPHEVPKHIVLVDEFPRNPLGKVVKPDLGRILAQIVSTR